MSTRVPILLSVLLFLGPIGPSAQRAAWSREAKFSESAESVFAQIDQAIESVLAERKLPGGVLWIEHQEKIYRKAYGERTLFPKREPATLDTIYDAASLTKVVATTPAIMLLRERGQLGLDDRISHHLPDFAGDDKEAITVRQLLTHTSGLRPSILKEAQWEGSAGALRWIYEDVPLTPPGTEFRYSDLGFILLGEMVRKIDGRRLDRFVAEEIFAPLKMRDTGFHPPESKRDRIAPTTRERGKLVHGIVHDPTARRMGGVAGHAGLFLTASDLSRFSRMVLNDGVLEGARILKPETVRLMTRLQTPETMEARRALGWDIESLPSSLRGEHFRSGFGHTGWTGTAIWVVPEEDAFVLFLSNRNHPDGKGDVKELRHRIGTLAALAVAPGLAHPVKNGIDVLVEKKFAPFEGLTVGLITNHTGRDRAGKSTIDLLHAAPGVTLKALFSPEHGIRGRIEGSVGDETDPRTGLKIHSLYREKTRKPSAKLLEGLDALVFDIQDIGCRFYTYISTMGLALEAAAENGLRFIVLDRVNPIGGHRVEGPVLAGARSFTGYHEIPVRHGMTAGELAQMFKAERGLKLELTVVPVEGWKRSMYFDDTGLDWINPSPNMRTLTEAILYPGIGLLEFMNLSVGRGTETPFELVGAPYINPETLAERLKGWNLPGVRFHPARFTPDASIFKGERCGGVRIELTDRDALRSVRNGIAFAHTLYGLYPEEINYERFQRLLVHEPTFEAVRRQEPLEEIVGQWKRGLNVFRERRKNYLVY